MDKSPTRVYVLMGDGEMAKGQVWEAAAFAAHYKLDNITVLADVNALAPPSPAVNLSACASWLLLRLSL